MSDFDKDKGIGDQIKDALQGALESGDFKELNKIVGNTVNSALTEAGKQIKRAAADAAGATGDGRPPGAVGRGAYTGQTGPAGGRAGGAGNGSAYSGRSGTAQGGAYTGQAGGSFAGGFGAFGSFGGGRGGSGGTANRYAAWNNPAQVKKRKKQAATCRNTILPPSTAYYASGRLSKAGQTSGTLMIVFGSIGTGISTLVLVSSLLTTSFLALGEWLGAIVGNALFLLAFILMIEAGCIRIERIKRSKRYINLFGGKTYCNVEDLALQTNHSKRFVLRDIKKMLKKGIFPQGHLDEQESCLMLDDETYRQYLQLEKERRLQEAQENSERRAEKKRPDEKRTAGAGEAEEAGREAEAALHSLMAQGQDCIRRLRDMNDIIEGEVISSKLFRLENVLKQIFGRVQEHPEQVPQMRKFMDYYLPTTLKLVQAYAEFDDVSAPGEQIISAKKEIEGTLDTINQAFEELLNKLFMDAAMDVTTDAQVLQTMLAQEGLTREPEFVRRG